MGPFALGEGNLAPGEVVKDRAAATGARVEGQQIAFSPGIRRGRRPDAVGRVLSGRMCGHGSPGLEGGTAAMRQPRVLVTSGDPGGVGQCRLWGKERTRSGGSGFVL